MDPPTPTALQVPQGLVTVRDQGGKASARPRMAATSEELLPFSKEEKKKAQEKTSLLASVAELHSIHGTPGVAVQEASPSGSLPRAARPPKAAHTHAGGRGWPRGPQDGASVTPARGSV